MSTFAKLGVLRNRDTPSAPSLVDRVDFLRLDASRGLDPDRQSEMGQFMTPPAVARLMAAMFKARGPSLRLLDAGAGVGSLTAAWVAEVSSRTILPRKLFVTAFEVDADLADRLRLTLEACRTHCDALDIEFESELRQEDFIVAGADALRGGLFGVKPDSFDCAILNPPYRKIQTDSKTHRLLQTLGAETTNLYAAFLSLAVGLLAPQGELVAITPRSFCNGPYFRPFRTRFLKDMALQRIHSFEARDRAFSEDSVLQENVIVHAVKSEAASHTVVVSSSMGPEDVLPTWREVSADQVVKPVDPDCFIHIPADGLSEALMARMEEFRSPLGEIGLEVSTGRVVDFRAGEFLRDEPGPRTVPLIHPAHMVKGFVQWPLTGGKKANALLMSTETEDLVVPPGFYVLVKRFSSKEERRRITAAIYDPSRLPNGDVAFENHVNYFHAHGRPLSPALAKGLALFLNSTLVDSYFREWSGHTQVNASDLRRLGYPSREYLEKLAPMVGNDFPDQHELDDRIERDLLKMPAVKKTPDPVRAKRRLKEVVSILKALGLPREQQNVRSALTLLALLDIKPRTQWAEASSPLLGITEMMGFFARHYGKVYAPNSRETVRRFTVHQFVQAGIAVANPDKPGRPTNSPQAVYQIEAGALALLKTYGTPEWDKALATHLSSIGTLQQRYAGEREMERIPLKLPSGVTLSLTPGGQNVLVKQVMDEFCPRFTRGATPIYIGDTGEKWAFFDKQALSDLGVTIETHGKMPDVVIHYQEKGWLVLVEAVTSHGPVSPKRHEELKALFSDAKAGLVFVTAFLTRRDLTKHLRDIAWETEVWVAEAPTHLIHFNGERFLGPF